MKLLKFNTISRKLLIRFVVIILVTLFILGLALAYLFQNYYYNDTEEKFIEQGKKIATLVQGSLYKGNYKETISFLRNSQRFFEGEVWIVNSKGLVLATTQEKEFQGIRLNKKEIEQAFRGKIISKRGFARYFEEPVLFTAVPIVFEERVIGAVCVYSPLAGLSSTLKDLQWLLFYAALLAITLAFILSFTLSKRFSHPLKVMKKIAVSMAHGNFSNRVEINSNDEIGQLASSFNYLADKLEKTIDSLQKKERLQRRFVADVSHELRTPLTSIHGFIKALKNGVYESKADQQEYYAIISEEVKRLIRLVNDLLDLSRLELGQIRLEQEPLNMKEIIKGVIKNLELNLAKKNLTINLNTSQEIPLVLADRDRIEQVLINLLSNAIDFTPQGERIKIDFLVEPNRVKILVEDTGPGIPKEELNDIWNRFHKVDKARTTSKGGTGLGLAIVKEIIDRHDGQVWVDSKEGVGSRFGFSLPRA
ncbi:histidine kinase,HAMP domain-containing protein,histidine kinase [Halobacteroides halobius DSM 5150]|uniref:histidine kinase n=1 Tax=Halobacteroides halobius (strain ATCC 35273 / DSM 5150 / MD-1) TaxID=748449 RepID=L0KAR7_HALHC|nr:ATP-binding protein [Halobacteroides halobius]AGB41464.1 histidine kinase,HAMP domain-containing protein,histidine kinase [Halobacteroides halobius DSM 5150]